MAQLYRSNGRWADSALLTIPARLSRAGFSLGGFGMAMKLVSLLRMAPGQTRKAFRDRYETQHVPFIRSVLPGIESYRRNYFIETTGGFDVMTELTFASDDDFDAAMAIATSSPVAQQIAADEEGLFDRAATLVAPVDMRE